MIEKEVEVSENNILVNRKIQEGGEDVVQKRKIIEVKVKKKQKRQKGEKNKRIGKNKGILLVK